VKRTNGLNWNELKWEFGNVGGKMEIIKNSHLKEKALVHFFIKHKEKL